jgi:acid phosphatase (class A)
VRLTGGVAATALMLGLTACAPSLPTAAPGTPTATFTAWLDADQLQALAASVPLPPAADSDAARADIAGSERLRALENTDRWLLATRHAKLRPALALSHFDCALGFRLTAADSPRLVALLERVLHDANETAELAKARAHRPRPVAADPDRPACQVASAAARASPSHPSGSATVGAAYGAAFAALVPEQAEALNRIGHQIAVSRMVCAMHYPSDVAAGETLGRAVFDAIAATPAFAADAPAARQEIAAARARGLTSPACAAERAALAIPLP